MALVATAVVAHPYPPYWDGGTGGAIHFAPVNWPASNGWTPYTKLATDIQDRANADGSNGGTSPQGYVNVSSGCTDQTLPSIYYAYDAGNQVLFFRWRVQSPPHNYATGPNPGSYSATSPWNSALWTVFIDTNGDGYRDFAVHLDGSSGGPSTAVDRIAAIWSDTKSQSLDYVNDARIHLIAHNPTAFVDGPSASDRLLNFGSALLPTANWPNGAAETVWDYGTTRATKLNTGCGEYFIDYQIPLAMLDATAVGGPRVTPATPMSLFFATANSLNNPLQKDVVVAGDFVADPSRPVPGGDTITPGGGTIQQPTVQSITVTGCGPATLSAIVTDTINDNGSTSVASVDFLYYDDVNADGVANDGGSWSTAGAGTASSSTTGLWTTTWAANLLPRSRYLIGVKATDQQGNITYSYLTQPEVGGIGSTPPHFTNPIGVVIAAFTNPCGLGGPSIANVIAPSTIGAGGTVTITVTITNPLGTPYAVASIADVLPDGFTYINTTGGTLSPTGTPTNGDSGTLQWTFSGTSVPASGSGTLIFTAAASTVAGTYSNTASANAGAITSAPAEVGVGAPSLAIAKSASVSSAVAGDPITYTISYSNPSAAAVTGAVITDVLPQGLDFVSATNGGSYNSGNRTVTWTIGAVAAGSGPHTVSLAVTVSSPYPQSALTPVVNTASIVSNETSSTGASSSVYVDAPRAKLSVQLDAASTLVAYNASLTYTLTYANIGQLAASNATLTLPIPTGWSFVSAANGGTNSAGTVTWSLGSLAAGASGSTQVTLRTGPAAYTGTNPSVATATLSATGVSPVSDPFTVGLTGLGNVCSTYYFRDTTANVGNQGTQRIANTTAVTLSDTGATATATSPGSATEAELVTFYQDPATSNEVTFNGTLTSTMWVSRSGGAPAVLTGWVYDHNPATGAETLLGSGSGTFNGNSVTQFSFNVNVSGTLASGHRLRWRYSFHSQNTNSTVTLNLLYGGGVSSTLRDSNSSFCVTTPATPTLDTQVSALVAVAGDTLTYTIPFGNAGANGMTSSEIALTLPAGVSFTSATLNGVAATPSSAGQVHTFAVKSSGAAAGTVVGGGTGTLVVVAAISQPFTGVGTALTASAAYSSTQTAAITDAATTTLLTPAVTISKAVSASLIHPGDTVTYTLDVLNAGPGSAPGVTVTDVLPSAAWFVYVPGSARLNGTPISPDPVSAGTLTYALGTMAAGATARITFDMAVDQAGVPAGLTPRANTASVSDAATSGSRSSETVTTTVSTSPSLTLTKTSSPASGPLAPGATIQYTLTLSNTGSAAATGVRLVDDIPANSAYAGGTLAEGGSLTDAADGDVARFDAAGNRVVFDLGSLNPGVTRTFTYEVVVDSPLANGSSTIGSTATLTAGNAATRTASTSIAVNAAPALTLHKSAPASIPLPLTTLAADVTNGTTLVLASADGIAPGALLLVDNHVEDVVSVAGNTITVTNPISAVTGAGVVPVLEYVFDYTNTGTADATGVEIHDQLDNTVAIHDATGIWMAAGYDMTLQIGTVPAGASGQARIRVFPMSAGTITNGATLTSNEAAPVTSNTVQTGVGTVLVTKSTATPSGATNGTGTTATYTIALENQNPSVAATNLTVTDLLPAGFTYLSTTAITGATAATSPTAGDANPVWTGISIAPQGTTTITFDARVSNVGGGTYQNEVSVAGGSIAVRQFDALSTTAEDVSIAAPLGTTGVGTITNPIAPGGTLTLQVADPDLNTNPSVAETVQVTVTNPRTSEVDTVTLTETSPSSGVFTATLATVDLPTAGANDGGPMNAVPGDTPTMRYADLFTSTGGTAFVDTASVVSNGPNHNPTANDDAFTVLEDAATTQLDVEANDSTAPDVGETLLIQSFTQGSQGGLVTLHCGQHLLYRPAANFHGTETFTYTVGDGNGGTATATVTMTVTDVNDPPTANPDTATLAEDAAATPIAVLANDSILPDTGETLTITSVTQGARGTVVITGGGTGLTYQPAPDANGADSFTYTISDGRGGAATATVSVTITPVNDPPTAAPDTATVAQDSSDTMVAVLTNDSTAPDTGETLTITAVTQGTHGGVVTITGGGATLTYHPAAGFNGTETFTYTIGDGNGGSATATVTMTVSAGQAAYRRYFSEGLNNPNVATIVSLANPANVTRHVQLEFFRQDGATIVQSLDLAPMSRKTIDTRTVAGLEHAPFATAIEAAATVVAERSMTWSYGQPGSSLEHAVEASATWYFAEGATTGRFSLFYLLMNPGTQPATATIDFLPQVGPPVQKVVTVPPHTRVTVPVNTVDPALASADLGAAVHSDLPIVVERSMYLSTPATVWAAGTTGAGVPAPLTRWHFGEGAVGPFFDAWILLANPSSTPATVDVHYQSEDGTERITSHVVPVGRRITIRVADDVPAIFASSFGAVVVSTNNVPIVAERAMWWPNDGTGWYEGHVGAGLPGAGHAWGVADGYVSSDRREESFVLIANTSTTAGPVQVTTVFDDGTAPIVRTVTIGSLVRMTLRMQNFVPETVGRRFSVFVESTGASPVDLVVEHSHYSTTFNFWDAGGSASASPIQ